MKVLAIVLVPLVAAAMLFWGGEYFYGVVSTFFMDHHFFHLGKTGVYLAQLATWGPLSLLIGSLVGFLTKPKAVFLGLISGLLGSLWLLVDALIATPGFDMEMFLGFFVLLGTAMLSMLIFVPIGSYFGARIRRA